MNEWDQVIFEELISDNHFIAWVRGEKHLDSEYWMNWEIQHPEHVNEFREAVKLAKNLQFKGTNIAPEELKLLWAQTTVNIKQNKWKSLRRMMVTQYSRIAAILLVPLLIVSGWLFFGPSNNESLSGNGGQLVKVVSPVGARIEVDLPDGSKVWLNSGSELSYPAQFSKTKRTVNLVGEAYFSIRKDEVPFLVSNLGPEIKVYGTEFNVNSYSNEDVVTVALVKGKISLNLNGREEFIEPGQASVYNKQKKSVSIENTDVDVFGCWREGKFIFKDMPLSTILRILQRQHNVNIKLLNPELGNYRYTATISNESLGQIMELLSLSAPLKYDYSGREVLADGTSGPENIVISEDKTRIVKPQK